MADINRNQEVADLYAEGSSVMSDNLSRLLATYGDFGQVTPSTINRLIILFLAIVQRKKC